MLSVLDANLSGFRISTRSLLIFRTSCYGPKVGHLIAGNDTF